MPDKQSYVPASFDKIVRVIVYIILISLATYAVMAVITHFSLNYLHEGYLFSQSLSAIFNTETAMFKFFKIFVLLEAGFVLLALFIRQIKDKIF